MALEKVLEQYRVANDIAFEDADANWRRAIAMSWWEIFKLSESPTNPATACAI